MGKKTCKVCSLHDPVVHTVECLSCVFPVFSWRKYFSASFVLFSVTIFKISPNDPEIYSPSRIRRFPTIIFSCRWFFCFTLNWLFSTQAAVFFLELPFIFNLGLPPLRPIPCLLIFMLSCF